MSKLNRKPMGGWRPGRVKPFSYDVETTPEGYHCTTCGQTGVKLWRDIHDARDAYCVTCLAALPPNGWAPFTVARVHADGTVEDELGHRSCQVAWKLPYRPCEDGEGTWGHSGGDNRSVVWWNSLPLLPHRAMPPKQMTFSTAAGDSCLYVRQDIAEGDAIQRWYEVWREKGTFIDNQRDKDAMIARLLESAAGLLWSDKPPTDRLYDVNDLLRGILLLVKDEQTKRAAETRDHLAQMQEEICKRKNANDLKKKTTETAAKPDEEIP